MYTPVTNNYRTLGYWFATGVWYTHRQHSPWVHDHSSAFSDYCARRRHEYETGAGFLPSVLELWSQFSDQHVFTPPTGPRKKNRDRSVVTIANTFEADRPTH